MAKITSVDEYIESKPEWKNTLELFRELMLETELEETIKWGAPYYTLGGKNVVGFVAFKNHAALWFPNGVFLDDPDNKLINAQEGVTKASRQLRVSSSEEIDKNTIRGFINQAIANQKAGKEFVPEKGKEIEIPAELANALNKDNELKSQFESLTPYKQKEYCEHISSAKREATRLNRLEKSIPMIRKGIGLHDKYR